MFRIFTTLLISTILLNAEIKNFGYGWDNIFSGGDGTTGYSAIGGGESQTYSCAYTSSFSEPLTEKECNSNEITEEISLLVNTDIKGTINLTFIVDVSSSMSDRDLKLTEDSIESLISKYSKVAFVNVNIIQTWGYNHGAEINQGLNLSGWGNENISVNLITDASGTDFDQGLKSAVESYKNNGGNQIIYFFADGDTYDAGVKTFRSDFKDYLPIWSDFIQTNDIEVHTIGINISRGLYDLETIGAVANQRLETIYVANISDLEDDLNTLVNIEKPIIENKTFSGKTTISEGVYNYDSITFESDAVITVSGKVKIYSNIVHINQKAEINCDGEPDNLFIGSYKNNMIINKDSKISANLFINGNLQIKKDTYFKGMIVSTDKQTGISYLNQGEGSCSKDDEGESGKIIQSDVENVVNVNAGSFKILDPKFATGGKASVRNLGVIEITDSNSSPADISYIKYDKVLAKSLNLSIEEFSANGQIVFNGKLSFDKWEELFQTVKFVASEDENGENFKVVFTIKSTQKLSDKNFQLGAVPTDPETKDSLTSTLKRWQKDGVEVKGYYGDDARDLTVITTKDVLKNPNSTKGLGYHKSTGLGIADGQILWKSIPSAPNGGKAQKIIIKFKEPITDVQVGFTGLGPRFIDSAKAVYEFYYKDKLVRSRGTLDRSADLDGDGFVATNITSTNLIVDKMIFSIMIEGENKNNANYSVRYVVGNYAGNESQIFTKIFRINIVDGNSEEDQNTSYSFKIVDDGKSENITTKIVGKEFKLKILVFRSNNSAVDSDPVFAKYTHPANLRWGEANRICKNKDMKLPTREEFKTIQNLSNGEYWTGDESNLLWAYLFRSSDNWTQEMQKINHKKVFCIGNTGSSSSDSNIDEVSQDFSGTIQVEFINSSISTQAVTFTDQKEKVITLTSSSISKNVGVKITYLEKDSYSEDNFSIRPKQFVISIPKSAIAGKGFDLDISVQDSLNRILKNYNETNSSNSSSINFEYSEVKSNCPRADLNISEISISDGRFFKSTSYPEVGDIKISISEKIGYEFSKIDANDGSGESRFIEPTSQNIEFNISKMRMSLSLNDNNRNYTYIGNDLNQTKASLSTKIKVLNSGNEIVKNFCKSCYSQDISSEIDVQITSSNEVVTLFGDNFSDKNITSKSEITKIINNISKNLFVDGEYQKSISLNFKRMTNLPLNPIYIKIVSSDISSPNIPNFSVEENLSTEKNATFYYARVIINDKNIKDEGVTLSYIYEIYLSEPKELNSTIFGESDISKYWYKHIDANSSRYSSKVSLNSIYENSLLKIEGTRISLIDDNSGINRDYGINIDAPTYLIYSRFEENATSNMFGIEFRPEIEIPSIGEMINNSITPSYIRTNTKTSW